MTERQILKLIDKTIELIKQGKIKEGYSVLLQLQTRLKEEIEKDQAKEYGKSLQHLMGWYLSVWGQQPPESLRFISYKEIIGKHLRELLLIYQQNGKGVEELKRDYEEYKKTKQKGILEFRRDLPYLKQQKPEWVSRENSRGKDFYLSQLWREDDEVSW